MTEVWLLMVAILGPHDADLKFYQPTVEFPTEESCRRQGAQVQTDYTDSQHKVLIVCAPP